MTNDLHDIANARGFGTGKAYRDRKAAEAECLALLPTNPRDLPTFVAGTGGLQAWMIPMAHFGNSSEDRQNWAIYHDGVTEGDAIGHDAADDAALENTENDE